jgi:two-component system, OmpR family, response regulator
MIEKPQLRLLYVEDNLDIAELAIMGLEQCDRYIVRHCTSGAAALEIIDDFKPDLCLLDVMMPKMDGVETLKRLRDIPGYDRLPVAFMTAKAQTHEQKHYLEVGADAVIVKPFDPLILGDQIWSIWEAKAPGAIG